MSIPKTSWINLQIKKDVYSSQHSWQLICFVYWKHCIGIASSAAVIYFNKCLPALFGELHWVTPILSCFSISEQGGTQDQAFTMLLRYSFCSGIYSVTVLEKNPVLICAWENALYKKLSP